MSSTVLKIIAVVSVLLAVILAAIGYKVSRGYAERAEQVEVQVQQQQAQQVLAVVALKPLSAYRAIARDDVALVPVSVSPADPYTNLDDVVNKVPLVDIDAGAPVTQRYFKEGNVLARIIPPDHLALSVEVNDVIAVGGFVRPGDIVDVLLYLRGGAAGVSPQSRVLLKAARVLAYEERIIDRPEGIKDDDKKPSRVRTAVLAVPQKETTKLMLGASIGELRLALHGQAAEAGESPVSEKTELPLTPEAVTAKTDNVAPEQAISLEELGRIKPPPSRARVAPRPRVEIVRGTASEVVTTK
ncbi:Flp pilus assembly protein CpaB [Sinimarinibacterium sp. CAU 1509]|uniref:Flp pilus assembly protein CpaB n=1 Tax=Sinimarinibacterium sp. CAU 1509 TaxID=2562283 RepID=UPI0010AC186E|nr:Flp pilus assembly protein CpaB [Sinimarinibacterium sp. CAU 1509]TJY56712.1 Flp pilus assembly protein CpaB [Sinimarinibacterium sp. CAU 1509]